MLNGIETAKAPRKAWSVGQSISKSDGGLGKTIYVDDNNTLGPWDGSLEHPYQYVQDAVANDSDGDTIFIFSGHYYIDTLIINKSITMMGEDRNSTIILQVDASWILYITADHVTIRNLTLWTVGGAGGGAGVSIGGDYCSVIDCSIIGFCQFMPWGVWMLNVSHILLQRCEIGSQGDNIAIVNCQDVIIHDNNIHASLYYNIAATNSTGMVISHNLIVNDTWNIDFYKCHGNVIVNNTLRYSSAQNIYLAYSSDNIITGNYLSTVWFNNSKNMWNGNYWHRPRLFPKLIFGEKTVLGHRFPDFQVDWTPLRQPPP
jgi:parallel beta-helix repeat protein